MVAHLERWVHGRSFEDSTRVWDVISLGGEVDWTAGSRISGSSSRPWARPVQSEPKSGSVLIMSSRSASFPMKTQSGLTIVARYSYLYEADLARSLLESENIESWLFDEHQIRHRWYLAVALGGVKLAVAPDMAEQAAALLAQDYSDLLATIPEQDLPGHPNEVCPRCGSTSRSESTEQKYPGPLQWLGSFLFLLAGALVPRRRFEVTRYCSSCGNTWSQIESR